MNFKPTEEQQNIIDLALEGEDLVINAFAGASKTTTLTLIANAKHEEGGEVGMYLAFNKAIANEAEERFPTSVECRTVHSLAYRHTPKALKPKIGGRIFPKELAELLSFRGEFIVSKKSKEVRKLVSINAKASMIKQTLTRFCNSADNSIEPHHLVKMDWMNKLSPEEFDFDPLMAEILVLTREYWEECKDPASPVPLEHDGYLKMYSMLGKQIPVSYIMIDENQDSSPVILNIIEAQKKAQKIYVGDQYQAIYGWRGAINAMKFVTGEKLYLTKSFRFGNNVETVANMLLKEAECEIELKGNGTTDGKLFLREHSIEPNAVICRTNSGVIKNVFEYSNRYPNKVIGASCDLTEIQSFVRAYEDLLAGKKVEHKLLYAFDNKGELMDYCDECPNDLEVSGMVKLIERFGAKALMAAISRCSNQQRPDIIVTTAHKSKGLEWDNVILYNDFGYDIDESGALEISDEEMNVIYVAATRAKKNLCISGIHDLLNLLYKKTGANFEMADESTEYLDHLNRVLQAAKANNVKFSYKGSTMEEVEKFAQRHTGLLKMSYDGTGETLYGFDEVAEATGGVLTGARMMHISPNTGISNEVVMERVGNFIDGGSNHYHDAVLSDMEHEHIDS
ncbi:3'-5' exonuclease [Acinetobacter baumannii]|uniref:3'-5' exonuclease n=1 Tax=Acinetobacter baumannii TaxID=470 RepID=UPI00366C102E